MNEEATAADEGLERAPAPAPLGPAGWAAVALIAAIWLVHALVSIVLLPIGRGPDENDHIDYANHLFVDRRLPDPRTEGVGQIQHPPLPYAIYALLWRACDAVNARLDPALFERRDWSRWFGRKTLFEPG